MNNGGYFLRRTMRTLALLGLWWAISTGPSFARECRMGYEPPTASFNVQLEDVQKADIDAAERAAVAEKMSAFQAKGARLRAEFRELSADMAMMLSGPAPDRSKVDQVAERMSEIISEILAADVAFSAEMEDLFRAGTFRKAKKISRHRSIPCDDSIAVPRMRYVLSGKEKSVIGLQGDELKYLGDFDRRDAYFFSEKMRVRAALDRAFKAKAIERELLDSLVEEWARLTRQQIINRLDRYFYADNVIFSTERMEKLRAFNAKHAKPVLREK